jgi:hypothetical protein
MIFHKAAKFTSFLISLCLSLSLLELLTTLSLYLWVRNIEFQARNVVCKFWISEVVSRQFLSYSLTRSPCDRRLLLPQSTYIISFLVRIPYKAVDPVWLQDNTKGRAHLLAWLLWSGGPWPEAPPHITAPSNERLSQASHSFTLGKSPVSHGMSCLAILPHNWKQLKSLM